MTKHVKQFISEARNESGKYGDMSNNIIYDTRIDMFKDNHSRNCWCGYCGYSKAQEGRVRGENIIKAEVILSAWLNYCRESRIYRILEFLKIL